MSYLQIFHIYNTEREFCIKQDKSFGAQIGFKGDIDTLILHNVVYVKITPKIDWFHFSHPMVDEFPFFRNVVINMQA